MRQSHNGQTLVQKGEELVQKGGNAVKQFIDIVAVGMLYMLLLILTLGILSRQIEFSLIGYVLVSQLLAVWFTFIMLGNVEIAHRHIEISVFYDRVPKQFQKALDFLRIGLTVVFVGYLLFSSMAAVSSFSGQSMGVINVPTPVLYISGVVGSILLLIGSIIRYRQEER